MSTERSWLARRFGAVASFSVCRPKTVLAAAAAVVAVALGLAGARLTLKTSNLDLIDPDLAPVQRFRDFADRFGTPNFLVVVLEGADPAALRRTADRLGPLLRRSPGVKSVFDKATLDPDTAAVLEIDPYFTSHDQGLLFLFVQPVDRRSSVAAIAPFVAGVEAVLERAVREPGVRAGLTGIPRYALDDRDLIQHDVTRLSWLSLALVLALFVAAFGALRRPLAAVAALVAGVAATLGLAAFYPGHLTLLSAFFASILCGLGIDYGIHIVDRVEELMASGADARQAVPRAVAALAPSLAASALTTSSLLWAMGVSGFRGFAELGVIAGSGVVVCLAAMVTVLPALLVLGTANGAERPLRQRRIGRALGALQSRPLAALLTTAALVGLLAGAPPFDSDYLDLQPVDSEAVRLEREMVRRSEWSPQFAAFTVDSRHDVQELVWQLVNDETVGKVRSLLDFETLLPGARPDLPDDLLAGFASADGHFAVYAYPQANVWDPAAQRAFVDHMLAIDPAATGMPILGRFMVERSQRAAAVTATVGTPLLLFWVFLVFRDVRWTLLAVLPTALTVCAVAGLMRLFGLVLNPLAVMALPVLLGIAVDDGIYIVHRFLAERGDCARTLAGAGRSVVLTSATTLAAFGALAFTSHRGLASFALLLSLGVATALVLSVLVLPPLLAAVYGRRSG